MGTAKVVSKEDMSGGREEGVREKVDIWVVWERTELRRCSRASVESAEGDVVGREEVGAADVACCGFWRRPGLMVAVVEGEAEELLLVEASMRLCLRRV